MRERYNIDFPSGVQPITILFGPIRSGEFADTKKKPPNNNPIKLSNLPLIEKAREWGLSVSVKKAPSMHLCLGHYDEDRKEIKLASIDAKIFLHELAHAAIERLNGSIANTELPWQEIMAELAAVALFQIVTKRPYERLGNSYQYISFNAVLLDKTSVEACLEVFSESERIIKLILE